MTQAEFDRLPGLLTRSQFLEATGMDKEHLYTEVGAGRIDRYEIPRRKRQARLRTKRHTVFKYYKREAARIGRFVP
jgi:hypothetical protein